MYIIQRDICSLKWSKIYIFSLVLKYVITLWSWGQVSHKIQVCLLTTTSLKCKIKIWFQHRKKHNAWGYKVHLHGYDWICFVLRLPSRYIYKQFLIFLFKTDYILISQTRTSTNVHKFFWKIPFYYCRLEKLSFNWYV